MAKDLLVLKSKKESYIKDGVTKEFTKYYVTINDIELQVSPADNTVRQVLQNYFEKGEIA